jgi:hypothetical protein
MTWGVDPTVLFLLRSNGLDLLTYTSQLGTWNDPGIGLPSKPMNPETPRKFDGSNKTWSMAPIDPHLLGDGFLLSLTTLQVWHDLTVLANLVIHHGEYQPSIYVLDNYLARSFDSYSWPFLFLDDFDSNFHSPFATFKQSWFFGSLTSLGEFWLRTSPAHELFMPR